jgi:hypothetical protein
MLYEEMLGRGGERLCCVALNEDKMAMLNLVLDSFIKPNW